MVGYIRGMDLPGRVVSALAEGRQAYVAVESKKGPHVTPELYTWSSGALWIAAASTTLKSRVLADHGYAAVVVRLAGRDVMMDGPVSVFDVRKPTEILCRLRHVPEAVAAGARFMLRNAQDLVAFAGDAVSGKIGLRFPPVRILFALRPHRVALIEGDAVVGAWGWDAEDAADGDLKVPAGNERCVAAFPGPVAVPCRWFPEERRIFIPPRLLALANPPLHSPIAFVVDEYRAPGPAAKWGRLHRGVGRGSSEPGYVDVTSDKVVEWNGVDVTPIATP